MPHRPSLFFRSEEKPRMARKLHLDAGYRVLNVDDGREAGDRAIPRKAHERWPKAMFRQYAAARHVDRALYEFGTGAVEPGYLHPRVRMKASAHALPAAEIAAFALQENELGDGGDFSRIEHALRQRLNHRFSFGRAPLLSW